MAIVRGPKGAGIMGPGGTCVCPECGNKTAHDFGVPCRELRCPDCGATMLREGSDDVEVTRS